MSRTKFAPVDETAPQTVPESDDGFLYVMDGSATPTSGDRIHELMHAGGRLKSYTFEYGKPLHLPFALAVRFLKNEGFYRTDAAGEEIPFERAPKRPEELAAGEKLTISDDQVIARYSELTNEALTLRAAMLPASEEVVAKGPREAVIKFIVEHNIKTREQNTVHERVVDEFTPPPLPDDL
jgi:hypothetical protein